MKQLLLLGAALTFVASVFLMRIVLHGYTQHGHLDVFHLVVAIAAAFAGVLLLLRMRRLRVRS
jgi:hypothetical protein